MRIPRIRTVRLLLRKPRERDADDLVALLRDPAITAFIPNLPPRITRSYELAWIRKARGAPEHRPEGLSYPLIIEKDGELVGGIGLRWDADERSGNIGYWTGRPFRGQGIATEAARALTSHAFRALGAERVWATADARNRASRRVLEKCGMKLEGCLRSHTVHRGRRLDVTHYSILRREWRARRW